MASWELSSVVHTILLYCYIYCTPSLVKEDSNKEVMVIDVNVRKKY